MNTTKIEKTLQLQEKIESLTTEIQKNASGNKAAGTRARKKIKEIQADLKEIRKLSLSLNKKEE